VLGPFSARDIEFVQNLLIVGFLLQSRRMQQWMLDGAPVQVRALVYALAADGVKAVMSNSDPPSTVATMAWHTLTRRMLEELGYTVVYAI
jgi:hypothetical protein